MGAQIWVLTVREQRFLPREFFHKFHQAARGLLVSLQEFHGRLVGGGFLRSGVAKKALDRDVLAARNDRRTQAGLAGSECGADAEDIAGEDSCPCLFEFVATRRDVAAGNVPCFVSDYANHLKRIIGRHQEPRKHKNILPAGHEGIQALVVNEKNPYCPWVEAGSLEQGSRIATKRILDFRITQEGYTLCSSVLRRDRKQRCEQQEQKER